ncbi:ribokinase [Opitutus sp. GAS368]|uniref:ribokinase n=1 Tax=Opitutus sp. GAS368 TaxID=1882749 RepID=UPI00087A6BA1|nr:ribokinase [Opitutus sp. GAS368]SDR92273.1 ribokinase [Opitutus sp. GAS368]
MKSSVVVVGSFVQDLAFYTKNFPRPGETVVGDFRPGPGGKGFNQAVAAARAGIPTLFIGAVGPDAAGAGARQFARTAGLHLHLVEKPKHATGAAVVTVNGAGQNHIIISLGANLGLKPRDIPAPLLAPAQVVVCQGESAYATVGHVLRTARRNGAITVFNPAPMRPEFDPAVLRHTEVLIPNESEFAALVKQCPSCAALLRTAPFNAGGEFTEATLHALSPEALHRLCRCLQVPVVIVTLGARGCFVSQPDVYLRIRAHDVEVVDTAGAGDGFVGGFAAGLVKFKHNIFEAAHYASAVAALSVMQPGTAPSMPIAREIARFLKKRDHR